MRIRIDLAYDGTEFSGWAKQPGLRTVQGDLEDALATVLRLPSVQVTCAGRTDTGVHARAQVVHLDVEGDVLTESAGRIRHRPVDALRRRLNGILRPDVRVRRVSEAPEGFDARFSALWRRYAYRIADDPGCVDPLTRNHVLAWPRPLDLDRMNEAAARCSASTTSPRSASGVRGPPRSARCSTCTGSGSTAWRSPGCAPTRSATTWCARWSAACSRSATAAGSRAWAAEVLAGRVRDRSVAVVPAPRAHPRGGRLPGRRRAGRPGPGDPRR